MKMGSHKFLVFYPFFLYFLNVFLCNVHGELLSIVSDEQASNTSHVQTYIIHVLRPDVANDLLSDEEREDWYRSFLPNTTLDSGMPRLVYSYHHAISGFAARLTPDELSTIKKKEGFTLAHQNERHPLLTTYSPEFLGLNQWKSFWHESNYGEGIIIGVVDSGVHITHPSFQDDGMPPPPVKWRGQCRFTKAPCNNKVIGGWGFLNGKVTSPEDTDGHGTHTASTAAGNYVEDAHILNQAKGTASGVAPRAHLAIYKACSNDHCEDIDVLKSIEQAIIDGVDIISASIGWTTRTPFHNNSVDIGMFSAVERGILASCAAGNDGPTPSTITNDAPWILTVGASSMDRRMVAIVKLGNGMELEGQSAYQPETNGTMWPLEYPGFVFRTQVLLACLKDSTFFVNVKGKIVMCGTGHIDKTEKAKIIKDGGGAAMIVMSQYWEGFSTEADPYIIPAAHLSHSDSLKIIDYYNLTRDRKAGIKYKGTQYGAPYSPAIFSKSSRGPSLINGGILKPDIIGPGVNILAAWPFELGPNPTGTSKTFYFGTGTSMAAPHLAGVAALLKKTHPTWSAAMIKSAIMTTARMLDRNGEPIADGQSNMLPPERANLFAMGAGHVDPTAANDPGLVYDVQTDEYIEYLCGLGYTDRHVSVIVRKILSCSSYGKISAEQLNYPSIQVTLNTTSKITVSRTVTNVGSPNSAYEMRKLEIPQGVSINVSPDELSFSSLNEQKNFTVELSVNGTTPGAGKFSAGQLAWVSGRYFVRSPVVVLF